jgi:hypothetical protein
MRANIQPFDLCGAACKREQSGQHLDDGRFSAAVRPEKSENFAALHLEADIVDRSKLPERPNEMFGGNCHFGRWI